MTLDEKCIKEADFSTFRKHIKKSVWAVWFKELEKIKLKHTKVQNIKYDWLRRPQSYVTNPNFDNEMSALLYNLWCKSVNTFRNNVHTLYGKEPACMLCFRYQDS